MGILRPGWQAVSAHQLISVAIHILLICFLTSNLSVYECDFTPNSISDFWDAIMTNQISEIDRANIARYEDAVVNAQRQRTAAITPKVIKLGVCIAQAWRRSRQ